MQYLLHQSIERSASRFPDKAAYVCMNERLSYLELENKTNQLAHCLMDQGVTKGDRVGIYMNRSIETAIAVYGILKCGAAYVPLDPTAPSSRTEWLIRNCGIQLVVTNRAQRKNLKFIADKPGTLQGIIGLTQEWGAETISWEKVFTYPNHNPQLEMCDQDLAYIIFTSGSTGTPKGIMHTHRSGLAYAQLTASLYGLTEKDRIGNHSPLHFDISTMGYLTAPLVAATAVIVTDAQTKMPVSLAGLIEKEKLTLWYSVPLALTQMLQSGVLQQKDMSSLRWALFGGEVFPTKNLNALIELWPQCTFSNVYGPAEVNQCTYYHLMEALPANSSIPLGVTWDNTEGIIVDDNDQEVGEGEIGELLIRSATMMAGYWQQPQLTANSLFKRPTEAGIEEVFYRTGDLVKQGPDGIMSFFGRKDCQVKIRGYRVELEEVADCMLELDAVEEAAAVEAPTLEGPLTLVAYVVKKKAASLSEKELIEHLSSKIPSYAIPGRVNWLEALPRTGATKIDYKKLRELARQHI